MTPIAALLSAMRGSSRRAPPSTAAADGRLSPTVVPTYVRRATIFAFAAQGLSREEIVRRTGFAYDAVAMLVDERTASRTLETSA